MVLHVMLHKSGETLFVTILEGPQEKEVAQEISKQLKEKYNVKHVRFLPKLGPAFKPRTVVPIEVDIVW